MFTVLSKAGPVRSLALAVELLWTGKTSYLDEEPCAYIYDLSPGVQALPNPGSSLEEVCGKNPTGDCQNYYYGHANVASDVNAPVAFIQGPGKIWCIDIWIFDLLITTQLTVVR